MKKRFDDNFYLARRYKIGNFLRLDQRRPVIIWASLLPCVPKPMTENQTWKSFHRLVARSSHMLLLNGNSRAPHSQVTLNVSCSWRTYDGGFWR